MSPVDILPKGALRDCQLSDQGVLSLTDAVLARLEWRAGDLILPSMVKSETLLLLLLRRVSDDVGYKLQPLRRRRGGSTSGGRLSLSAFTNDHARYVTALPVTLDPIFLTNAPPFELALVIGKIKWHKQAFSANGLGAISPTQTGVYQLLSSRGAVVYVGEGVLSSRMSEHLQKEKLHTASDRIRYLLLPKEDAMLMERVLLTAYKQVNGELPPFNKRLG